PLRPTIAGSGSRGSPGERLGPRRPAPPSRLTGRNAMYATILLHAGMAGHAGRFAAHQPELEGLLMDLPGLLSFHLIETSEGVAALIVGRDRAACDECLRRGGRWMDAPRPDLAAGAPVVVSGAMSEGTLSLGTEKGVDR